LNNVLRNPHFWIIAAIMVFGGLIFYADRTPLLNYLTPYIPIQMARYSTYRILSIIPVAYAAFIFGIKGGVTIAVFVSLALLPRALFFSDETTAAVLETVAFFLIGLLVSWLIHRQQRAVQLLENAGQELQTNLQIVQNREKRLTALNQISGTVSESLELSEVLSAAIDNVVDVMQVDVAWIFLLDEETSELLLAAHRGASEEFAHGVDKLKLGEGLNGRVAQSGQPLFVEDASKDERLTREVVSKFQMHSTLIVPLISKKKVNGTMCIAMRSFRNFSPDEVELMTAMGYQIGVAVDNAHLYRQQQAVTEQLRLSEERYRGLFENASDAILVCSTDGHIISVNRACEELTGYTRGELTSTAIYELFSGVDQEKVKQMFSGKLDQAVIAEVEGVRLTRKNSSEAFIEFRTSTIFKGDDAIGLQVIARDVTEERQLRQNMEYYVKQITKAQEDERLRISRELHDDTAQILAALSRDLDSLNTKEKGLKKSVKERIKKLQIMTDSALEGVRRFSQDLRPSILDDLGLVPALEWLIKNLETGYGMRTQFSVTGKSHRLAPEMELTVFRIVQEVLSNVRKHSKASSVETTVDFGDDKLTIVASDDGQGFDLPKRPSDLALSGKLGVIGMQERARLIGGTLNVQSARGEGTRVTLSIPC
jgi:PAS domain S-box-containing protein